MKKTLKMSMLVLGLGASSLLAQNRTLSFFGYEGEPVGPKSPAFTFSVGGGNYLFGDYSRFQRPAQRWENMWQYGLRAGFAAHPNVELEGLFSFAPSFNVRTTGASENVWVYHYAGQVLLQLPGWITPYALLGMGGMTFDPATEGPIHKFTINYGGGLKVFIGRNLALRPEAFATTSFERVDTAFYGNLLLTYYIGRQPTALPVVRDQDSDGIPDNLDQCPTQPETFNNYQDEDGCPDEAPKADPLKDTDGDGIPDFSDKCPTQPETLNGFQDEDGCPDQVPAAAPIDTDKDGIIDSLDKCPTEPENVNGYQDEDGCPDQLPRDLKELIGPIEGIHFELDSNIIREESYPILENAVAVFKKYSDVRVLIEGHTDNTGPDAYNLRLSGRRAESVRQYILSRGVAPERVTTKGFGESKPRATNKTAEGRALNRRIEFKLVGGK